MLLLALIFSLVVHAQGPKVSGPDAKFLKILKRKCGDGIATACHDYGLALMKRKSAKDQKAGKFYIRRACTLAYAPACETRKDSNESKLVPAPSEKGACNKPEITNVLNLNPQTKVVILAGQDSPWHKAGMQNGDMITAINGKPYTGSPTQLQDAIADIPPVITVKRNGVETSLVMKCP